MFRINTLHAAMQEPADWNLSTVEYNKTTDVSGTPITRAVAHTLAELPPEVQLAASNGFGYFISLSADWRVIQASVTRNDIVTTPTYDPETTAPEDIPAPVVTPNFTLQLALTDTATKQGRGNKTVQSSDVPTLTENVQVIWDWVQAQM